MVVAGAIVQRRADAGDPNFMLMLKVMGGTVGYERRLRWCEEPRHLFVGALSRSHPVAPPTVKVPTTAFVSKGVPARAWLKEIATGIQ